MLMFGEGEEDHGDRAARDPSCEWRSEASKDNDKCCQEQGRVAQTHSPECLLHTGKGQCTPSTWVLFRWRHKPSVKDLCPVPGQLLC